MRAGTASDGSLREDLFAAFVGAVDEACLPGVDVDRRELLRRWLPNVEGFCVTAIESLRRLRITPWTSQDNSADDSLGFGGTLSGLDDVPRREERCPARGVRAV